MKTWLLPVLVCPSCLPREHSLELNTLEQTGCDIEQGDLKCSECNRIYPIRNGILFIHPDLPENGKPNSKYENSAVVSSYLWSHYSDLLNDPEGSSAYQEWSKLMHPGSGMCLDMGSAVGRFTFEMSSRFDYAVGMDDSASFVRAARELMVYGRREMELPEEGVLVQTRVIALPEEWRSGNVEFIVADALVAPFASGAFSSVASLNMVDKLPKPLQHLKEANRLARRNHAQFLLSDPFSWSLQEADQEEWLGGKQEGRFAGYGLDNIVDWIQARQSNPGPGWSVEKQGHVWWKIRTHRNHFELIRSAYVKARR